MSITNPNFRSPYTGNGSTTSFPTGFYFLENSDVSVIQTDTSGNSTTLVQGTDYTITGALNPSGGTVITTVPVPDLYQLTVIRTEALTQQTSFITNAATQAALEQALDKVTMITQQIAGTGGLADRSIKYPVTEPNGYAATLPAASVRANTTLGFDANGVLALTMNGVIGVYRGNYTTGTNYNYTDTVLDPTTNNLYAVTTAYTSTTLSADIAAGHLVLVVNAAAATASETAAATSAASASVSATTATTAATTATTQAGIATTQATAASTSATAAAGSATSASGSATAATTQASNASASAVSAAASAASAKQIGPWATGTTYATPQVVFGPDYGIYECATGHTSGTFSTDIATGKWNFLGRLVKGTPTTITASGTYTPAVVFPVMVFAEVELWGGAGSGGSATSAGSSNAAAAGGNSGSYIKARVLGSLIGTGCAVSIGAGGTDTATPPNTGGTGGTSTFGPTPWVTAPGGLGGFGLGGATTAQCSTPNTGSSAPTLPSVSATAGVTLLFASYGRLGEHGLAQGTGGSFMGGNGADAPMDAGMGGWGATAQSTGSLSLGAPGNGGIGHASGGSGAVAAGTSSPWHGGAGAAGLCIVTPYYFQQYNT